MTWLHGKALIAARCLFWSTRLIDNILIDVHSQRSQPAARAKLTSGLRGSFMSHALFTPEVKYLLQENDTAGLAISANRCYPATVAESLVATFRRAGLAGSQTYGHRTSGRHLRVFSDRVANPHGRRHGPRAWPSSSRRCRRRSPRSRDEARSHRLGKLVASSMKPTKGTSRRSFAREKNTAAQLMTTDYAWLPPTLTASEALIDCVCSAAPARRFITSSSLGSAIA